MSIVCSSAKSSNAFFNLPERPGLFREALFAARRGLIVHLASANIALTIALSLAVAKRLFYTTCETSTSRSTRTRRTWLCKLRIHLILNWFFSRKFCLHANKIKLFKTLKTRILS